MADVTFAARFPSARRAALFAHRYTGVVTENSVRAENAEDLSIREILVESR
jgi:hypothetical protein